MNDTAEHSLDESIGYLVSRAALRYKCEMGRRIKDSAVTPEQWVVLHRLWERDGLSQKELAGQITKDQSSLTHMLDKLERKGLVRRADHAADRRAFLIFLTDRGRELVTSLFGQVQQLREDACQGMTQEERESLKSLLTRFWANLA